MIKYLIHSKQQEFEYTQDDIDSLDVIYSDNNISHAIFDGKSYEIEHIEIGNSPKTISVSLAGQQFSFQIKDAFDQLVDQLGMDTVGIKKMTNVIAPMPGLILDILVNEGQQFEEGDPLFILEAMKMENVIKAEGSGTVKEILCSKGQTVEKSQIILDLEEQ